jgi:hypothetical protein
MSSGGKNRLSILPREDAAALIITDFTFLLFAISKNPIAVKGFTKDIEAC